MKRIVCVIVFLLSLTSVFAQGISPEIGRRLTWWTNSKDSREALVYQILRDIYPNEAFGALVRRVDSFSVNLTDAGSVLIGIYNSLGPDYGYTSLRDGFTRVQMDAIEQYYIDHGGRIKKARSEADRAKQSALASKRGITIDMAWRLADFLEKNPNMMYYASSVLSDKGISSLGAYRVLDRFDENLDYVEDVIMAIYDRSGSVDGAYYTLRYFLTLPQIDVTNALYGKRVAVKEKERQRKIAEFVAEVRQKEPYQLSSSSISTYKGFAFDRIDRVMRNADVFEYSIVLKDSIFVDGSERFEHRPVWELSPSVEGYRHKLDSIIHDMSIEPFEVRNRDLNYTCNAAGYGYYSVSYSVTHDEYLFEVKHNKQEKGVLLELESNPNKTYLYLEKGDEDVFEDNKKVIRAFLVEQKKFGKQKVKVVRTLRNGVEEDVDVVLLDKKAVVE